MTAVAPLLFQGTLLNQQGAAIQNAKIQLWQTDLDGNYLHPDPGAAANPASSDHASVVSDFQYFGTDDTDSDGRFQFLTYRPGVYPNRPYSHFHFMVWLNDVNSDGGEYEEALVTQFYFRDESPPYPEVLQLDVIGVDSVGLYDYGSYVNGTIVIETSSSTAGDAILEITPEQSLGPFYPIPDFFSMDNDLTSVDDSSAQTATPTGSPQILISTPFPTSPPVADVDDTSAQTANPTSSQTLVTPFPTTSSVAAVDDTSTQTANPTVSEALVTPFPTAPPATAVDDTSTQTANPSVSPQTLVTSTPTITPVTAMDDTSTKIPTPTETPPSEPASSATYWQGMVTAVVGFALLNVAFAA
jgi:protocatechuate 3,4-dioxygenase beta subunit